MPSASSSRRTRQGQPRKGITASRPGVEHPRLHTTARAVLVKIEDVRQQRQPGGGYYGEATGPTSVVSGGVYGEASGNFSAISGGYKGLASNYGSVVLGGENTASGFLSAVLGGAYNTASGYGSTVQGGWEQEFSGSYSYGP
ncbi:MAG: hypothetical protein ACI8S6_004123 [Myxococcota bacterium]|jgi:hypothetical protein